MLIPSRPKTIAITFLVLVAGILGVFWWRGIGIFAEPDSSKAERYLGAGAVCGTSRNATLRCTKDGVVLTCVVHGDRVGCGTGDHPMPESAKE